MITRLEFSTSRAAAECWLLSNLTRALKFMTGAGQKIKVSLRSEMSARPSVHAPELKACPCGRGLPRFGSCLEANHGPVWNLPVGDAES